MIRPIAWALGIWLLVALGLGGIKAWQIRAMIAQARSQPLPVEYVSVFTVRQEHWPRWLSAVGTVQPVRGIRVATELPGVIREVAFEGGEEVESGRLLVRLDTSAEEADLREAEARVELARLNRERVRALRETQTVSQAELDEAEATWKQAQARVDAIRAAVDKKTIRAPFAGVLGVRDVHPGQFLQAGQPIVSLQTLDPVYLEFSLPQQVVGQVRTGLVVEVRTDAYPDRVFRGHIMAMDPDLQTSTRSLRLQALLSNPDRALRPGMYARVTVVLPEQDRVVMIPSTAVLSAPYGDSVFVVEPGAHGGSGALVARQQFVKLGQRRGDFVSVTAGLEPGQQVVSAGVFRLRNGMPVAVTDVPVPEARLEPQPPEG